MDAATKAQIQQQKDFPLLLGLTIDLVQSRAGPTMPSGEEWLVDASVLGQKLIAHLTTLGALTNPHTGQTARGFVFGFIDHSSIQVVTRAAFETYLAFAFVYGGGDRSISEFRHKIWRFAGLVDRQRLEASTANVRSIQAAEKLLMDALKNEIEGDPRLQAYSAPEAKLILKGDWRAGASWGKLAEGAGFHKSYFKNVYSHMCGYSHASWASAIQVRDAQTVDDQFRLASMNVGIGLVLMSQFARSFVALFPDAKGIVEADRPAKAAADRWHFSADEWERTIRPTGS